jgi:hypothetical protein
MMAGAPPPAPPLPPGHPLRVKNPIELTPDLRKHDFLKDPYATGDLPKFECQTCGLVTWKPEPRLDALVKCEPRAFVSELQPPPKVKPVKWKRPADAFLEPPSFWASWKGSAVFGLFLVGVLALMWRFL